MLQNEYLGAKIGVDTAENEPSKVWPIAPSRGGSVRTLHDSAQPGEAAASFSGTQQARGKGEKKGEDYFVFVCIDTDLCN